MTMVHKQLEIWDFLRKNGVVKVGRIGEKFEFLIGNRVISPPTLFTRIAKEINSCRPKKVVTDLHPIPALSTNRFVSQQNIKLQLKPKMGFRDNEAKRLEDNCLKDLEILRVWWIDLEELFQMVRAGFENMPPDLIPEDNTTRTMVSLVKAIRDVVELMRESRNTESCINICRVYLLKHSVIGKPGYTPIKLRNNVSQFINTHK